MSVSSSTEELSHETLPLYEPLTYERLGELISGANNEGKALLTLAMAKASGRSQGFTYSQLHDLLEALPGSSTTYLGSKRNQGDWCNLSLGRIGVVEKLKDVTPRSFMLTREGRAVAVPLYGLLLDFSDRHDRTLVELLGESARAAKLGSPYIRIMMMETILTSSQPPSLPELVQITGVATTSVIENHLTKLSNSKLITYEAPDRGVAEKGYVLTDKDYEVPSASRESLQKSIEYLKTHESATLTDLIDHVQAELPSSSIATLSRVAMTHRLARDFYALKRSGIMEQINEKQRGEPVRVTLSEEQLVLWTELLAMLKSFCQGDPHVWSAGRELAQSFVKDPQKVSAALERAANSSAKAQNGREKSIGKLLLGVFAEDPTPRTIRELVRTITIEQGRPVSRWGVRVASKKLAELGVLELTGNKRGSKYAPLNPTSKD